MIHHLLNVVYNNGAGGKNITGIEDVCDVGRVVLNKKLNDSLYGKKRGRKKNIYKWVVGNKLRLPQSKQFGTTTNSDIKLFLNCNI